MSRFGPIPPVIKPSSTLVTEGADLTFAEASFKDGVGLAVPDLLAPRTSEALPGNAKRAQMERVRRN